MADPDCSVFRNFIEQTGNGLKASRNDGEATAIVEHGLPELLKDGGWLCSQQRTPNPETYARNLIYRDPALGFVVVAMVWLPGQGTPVHDHSGIWCVEGVLEGSVRITQYDPIRDPESTNGFQLKLSGRFESAIGETGRLIPPFEYHKIENLGDETAITVHVYGKDLLDCKIFEEQPDGSFQMKTLQMQYDPVVIGE